MAAILGKILNGEVTLEDLDFPLEVDGKEVSYTYRLAFLEADFCVVKLSLANTQIANLLHREVQTYMFQVLHKLKLKGF